FASIVACKRKTGEGNVQKYGGIPPFRETQDYVRRVSSRYSNLYAGGINISPGSNSTPANAQVIAQSAHYDADSSPSTQLSVSR
ncbi:lytic transglycosylase domain-containing protein, partial [Pseudomonas sp. SIMBA_068]|uniref:lytic transglycosylase domain-containing protein n=1 Tax=Pseudomonas sp. SIMBA_068 TaxID=3085808 RepID=UPI0039795A92